MVRKWQGSLRGAGGERGVRMMEAEVHLVSGCEFDLYISILRMDESRHEFSILQRHFLCRVLFYMFARAKSFARQLARNHVKQELEDKGHCESCSDHESKLP